MRGSKWEGWFSIFSGLGETVLAISGEASQPILAHLKCVGIGIIRADSLLWLRRKDAAAHFDFLFARFLLKEPQAPTAAEV